MKAGPACPSSPDVPPGIARAVQLIPDREQNWLICARRQSRIAATRKYSVIRRDCERDDCAGLGRSL
jgi:hypothetical protein